MQVDYKEEKGIGYLVINYETQVVFFSSNGFLARVFSN